MPPRDPITQFDTHEVTNQPPPLVDYNLYDSDPILRQALRREGAARYEKKLGAFGAALGSETVLKLGELPPTAKSRSCVPSTATASASTRWNSTPPITSS